MEMNMNNLVNVNNKVNARMTSLEISELVDKRHDNVKRLIDNLLDKGVIVQPQIEDVHSPDSIGRMRPVSVYVFSGEQGYRDSIVVVAQLSPEFTGALVDRWQELEGASPKQLSLSEASEEFITLKNLALAFGLDKNPALISANNATISRTGYNFQKILNIELESFEQRTYMTPTEIGKRLNTPISGQKVNKWLEHQGYQENSIGVWMPTEKGSGNEKLSQKIDTGKKHSDGAMIQQVKWCSSLIAEINAYFLDD